MTVEILFEGRRIDARAGETVAAALTAAGERVFRTTAQGAGRGMFCGMGVCQDCLVRIDGAPNQRACMRKVAPLMRIERESERTRLQDRAALPPVTADMLPVAVPDILVIGAGPGGLSAAIAARSAGANVMVLDEREQGGGQYYKQPAVALAEPDRQARRGAALIETAHSIGVWFEHGVSVWGAFQPCEILANGPAGLTVYRPKALIVATGAYERAWPVPGWTLPGVMTTGAAQTLWRTARRLPGRRVLIAGNGPLNLQLAAELLAGGAQVVALSESAGRPGWRDASRVMGMAVLAPDLLLDGILYHLRRIRGKTPILHRHLLAGVTEKDGALCAELHAIDGGGRRQYDVDAVCIGYGFEPANDLLRMLDCVHSFDTGRGQLVPERDSDGATSIPGVFALGDCTGLGGARVALAEGRIVGAAAARYAGFAAGADIAAQRSLRRHRDFQAELWGLYSTSIRSPLGLLTTADTILCRCEEVTLGAVESALAGGAADTGTVKRRCRIGMGRCQGRYCGPMLDALCAARAGSERNEFSGFAPRAPLRPIAIEDLARPGKSS